MFAPQLESASGRLRDSWEVLTAHWSGLQEYWQDANARDFGENHLQPLSREMQLALPAISHLAQVIAAAERELADDPR